MLFSATGVCRRPRRGLAVAFLLGASACSSGSGEPDAGTATDARSLRIDAGAPADASTMGPADIAAGDWRAGEAPRVRIAAEDIRAMGGQASGPALWVSNNPEKITGNGWTMQNARTDATRGGERDLLTGTFAAYFFHINGSASVRYFHLLATNPQNAAITVKARGTATSNTAEPLGQGSGQSYEVARRWLADDLDVEETFTIAPGEGAEIARVAMGPNVMIDGRFELDASAGTLLYGVVTSTGEVEDAINGSQNEPAPGIIVAPGTNEYGRQAGIYEASQWTGATIVDVPAAPAHVGIALGTHGKFALDGVTLQEQGVAPRSRLDDSADMSWGNYGFYYAVTLVLRNPASEPRQVTLSLAANFVGDVDSPSFTWNGPALVDRAPIDWWVTPRSPRQELGTYTLGPGEIRQIPIETYVPGLITAGHHLLLEAE